MSAIRFLLGEDECALRDVPPTLTVLEYLRRQARRTGTKEGCAEGDCGACTVVLAEPDGAGRLRHWAINACIQFVPALHGRQLLTVEDVKHADGTLHPVQQALVDHHGSQCGFCTPGFVMQLYAGWLEGTLKDRQSVKDWLAGNLCRCTGYGPIIDAGLDVAAAPGPAAAAQAVTARRLAALDDGDMLHIRHGDQEWFAPRSIDELAEVYSKQPDAVLVAGATDVGLWVTKQQRHLATLIDVTRVAGLNEIKQSADGLSIGATVSHREATAALGRLHPDLGELFRRFASIQIRNAGTVGGNIANASPIGDLAPALIALGATLRLRRGAARRELPLEAFFLAYGKQDRAPGEFVEALQVPRVGEATRFACYKISRRFDQDISAVMGAFAVTLQDNRVVRARVAYGGIAATSKRAEKTEATLTGQPFEATTIERACSALTDDFTPITDMRASTNYRLLVAQNLWRRFHLENSGEKVATRVLELIDDG
ncbi:MAG TPA: xanthine dehydrogenase small subunit [Xanthobacteraceae bacterium]|nr:xanthine dehydrogenase small subunit [Xanthobacteraceae bacterium]